MPVPAPAPLCEGSKPRLCRELCSTTSCAAGECLMRNDNCCDLVCQDVKPVPMPVPAPAPLCEGSKPRLCRELCSAKSCPAGECLMRNDNCCDLVCQDIKTVPMPVPAPAQFCEDSKPQL